MKKMYQFMMGMLAIAAATLTSCSDEDAMGMNSSNSRQDVENFYMKLQVTGNADASSTRTSGDTTNPGTTEESTITTGTIWLVDDQGAVKFSKKLTAEDWNGTDNTVTNPIKVAVTRVMVNTTYHVYFLANREGDLGTSPISQTLSSETGGLDYAHDNAFVMFNQNDEKVKADQYTVSFTASNKDKKNPAMPTSAIKLDRATARIDYPTSVTAITQGPTKAEKTQNIEAIQSISLQGFSPFNVVNIANMEQKWDKNWVMQLPSDWGTFYLPKESFGDGREHADTHSTEWFIEKTYVFENTQSETNKDQATGIFLKYVATTNPMANHDFADGTFYRYDKHVFTSIQDIIDFTGAANPFGSLKAEEVVALIKDNPEENDPTKVNLTTDKKKIEDFRKTYNIEVFERGEVYYPYYIEDAHHTGMKYSVLRNSIYQINVSGIYDLGTDTPNTPDIDPNYYLDVEVTVSPWVLNTIDIKLN